MVMEERELQTPNAVVPILVTPFGMVMEVREIALKNAAPPILVTLVGMLKELAVLASAYCIIIVCAELYKLPSKLL
jgi:hypothetical protein